MEKIKILIADDHTMFCQTLRKTLKLKRNIEVVGEVSNGAEAVQKCQQFLPDVILMDLEMPEMDGIEATRIIKQNYPTLSILALTMHEDDGHLFEAIRAGVNGYILKDSPLEKLLAYIEAVAQGGSILNSSIAKRVMDEFAKWAEVSQVRSYQKLTLREIEILQLLTDGKTSKEIAQKLFISQKTVKNHISNIYPKLDCHDRTQAILQGKRLGLLKQNNSL